MQSGKRVLHPPCIASGCTQAHAVMAYSLQNWKTHLHEAAGALRKSCLRSQTQTGTPAWLLKMYVLLAQQMRGYRLL